MIFARSLALVAAVAGIAYSAPFDTASSAVSLDARQQSACSGNGTLYTSVSAGQVCIYRPSDCTETYIVDSGETCTSIVERFNSFTYSMLYYWNPDIGKSCLGLRAYVPVCVSTPWYTFTPPAQRAEGTVLSVENLPATEQPVPQMPSIVPLCNKFYFVGGERVDSITQKNGISQNDFLDWNPAISRNDPVAWWHYWVCVGVSAASKA